MRWPGARWRVSVLSFALLLGASTPGMVSAQEPAASAAGTLQAKPERPPGCTPESEPNDLPEQAPSLSGEMCYQGTLVEKADQDLWFWEVKPEDGLATWTFTISGVTHATTSVHVIRVVSEPGVLPPATSGEATRADSSDTSPEPGVIADLQLPPGLYLLGVSRADPVAGRELTDDRDYWFSITRRLDVPPSADAEANDDPATASPIEGAFDISGDLGGSTDLYRWTIGPADAERSWRLEGRTSLHAPLQLELRSLAGAQMAAAGLDLAGLARIHDLRLPAGDYILSVGPAAATAQPYVVGAVEVSDPLADPEPNGSRDRAVPMDPATLSAIGRLAGYQDRDFWSFEVDEVLAATQLDIELRSDPGGHDLCLQGVAGPPIKCRSAYDLVALQGLGLPAGRYTLEVSGASNLDTGYRVSIIDIGPPAPDREIEPNDRGDLATPWDPSLEMQGRFEATDLDHFRVEIAGEPQLWTVNATGTGIGGITWVAPDGSALGSARPSPDGTSATLTDLYVLPGQHTLALRGGDGEYTLTLSSQGGPDPNAEREPNDDLTRAELVAVGGHKTGRQTNGGDIDIFRFSLANYEHLVIRFEPPADGSSSLELLGGGSRIAILGDPVSGVPVVYDARLYPGDYSVWLRAVTPSDGQYRLSLERADPFITPADLEPNDTVSDARPLPPTLVVEGSGWGGRGEDDWYALPPITAVDPLRVAVEGSVLGAGLHDGTGEVILAPDGSGAGFVSTSLSPGLPYAVRIKASGPYRVSVSGGGLMPADLPPALPVTLALTPSADAVAAWWPDAQRLEATLEVVNTGSTDLVLALEATTSHAAWSVGLTSDPVGVPAGGAIGVPLAVTAPPDRPADLPVAVTVRAADAAGAQATAATTIEVSRTAPAVDPTRIPPLPEALYGGLDVASTAAGGVPVPSIASAEQEALLHDGLAMTGSGFSAIFRNAPLELTVDLAGDEPVSVAGLVVNPLGGDGSVGARPRDIELQLSEDGATWSTVLVAELSPSPQDQPFVLDAPIPARLARLRILSSFSGTTGSVSLGEWKVVAPPGVRPVAGPVNIADPLRGGHVVWMTPQPDSITSAYGVLSEDPTPWVPIVAVRKPVRWVVGFWNDRAAQVTELQWVDPPASDPASRSSWVDVEISTATPLGPWESLGDWGLDRAADGSVPPFVLPSPRWARFLRFTMPGPQDSTRRWEMPSTLRVLERPTDSEYRSILGEWGASSPAAIYEVLVPPSPLTTNESVPDAPDDPQGAAPIPAGEPARGRVTRNRDVDWYELTVPEGQDTLYLDVRHGPGGGVALSLQDLVGAPVRLYGGPTEDPYASQWSARVKPGTYRVRVEQPLLSAAFAFDTSGSMSAFVPFVREALRTVARGVSRGDEVVKLYPFGEKALNEWSDDTYLLEQTASGAIVVGVSSDAEATMLPATKALGARLGTRAMLVLTDAETTSYYLNADLWEVLATVRPLIYATHVLGAGDPALTTHLMQDWALSSGGRYQYASGQADIDHGFDRMVTTLRRPADYALSWKAEKLVPPQATIRVATPLDPYGVPLGPPLGAGVGVELVLDTSGSMLQPLGTSDRITVARNVLQRLVAQTIPEGIPVALRTFKARKKSCDTQLVVPFEPFDRAAMSTVISGLKVVKSARTPLGKTLAAVGEDLAGTAEGPKVVVFVTDGAETCGGDPEAEVQALVDAGIEVTLDIVGFALDDPELKASMEEWAAIGGGVFFDAQDEETLLEGMAEALQAPFRVYDESGGLVARGRVGGPIVRVPGYAVYRVEVLSDPPIVYEDVALGPGDSAEFLIEPEGQ